MSREIRQRNYSKHHPITFAVVIKAETNVSFVHFTYTVYLNCTFGTLDNSLNESGILCRPLCNQQDEIWNLSLLAQRVMTPGLEIQ